MSNVTSFVSFSSQQKPSHCAQLYIYGHRVHLWLSICLWWGLLPEPLIGEFKWQNLTTTNRGQVWEGEPTNIKYFHVFDPNFLYFPFMSVCVDFIRMIRIITKYVNARLLGYWSLSDSFLTFTVFPHIHDIFLIFLLFLFARCCSTSSVTQTTTCWASMPPTHFQFVLETAVVMGGVM